MPRLPLVLSRVAAKAADEATSQDRALRGIPLGISRKTTVPLIVSSILREFSRLRIVLRVLTAGEVVLSTFSSRSHLSITPLPICRVYVRSCGEQRGRPPPEEVDRHWNIFPPAAAENVVPMASTS
jgi:hypothetical protein